MHMEALRHADARRRRIDSTMSMTAQASAAHCRRSASAVPYSWVLASRDSGQGQLRASPVQERNEQEVEAEIMREPLTEGRAMRELLVQRDRVGPRSRTVISTRMRISNGYASGYAGALCSLVTM